MPAAQGMLPLASRGSTRVAELTVVRHGGRFYRLTGLHEPGDATGAAALAAAAASFRSLSAAEAARIRPLRIRIHRDRPRRRHRGARRGDAGRARRRGRSSTC